MELMIKLIEFATAVALLVRELLRIHPKVSDDSRDEEEEDR